MSATVTIPARITVIDDAGTRHDLAAGTYPIHATTTTGDPVPAGERPHFLEVDLPACPGPGILRLRILAFQDHFTADTEAGTVRILIGTDPLEQLNQAFGAKPEGAPSFRAEHEGDDYLFGRRPVRKPADV